MKNTLKRIVSIALMLCMLLSNITFTASADDCDCADCMEQAIVCTDDCCDHDHDHEHEEDEALLTEPDGDDASAEPAADTDGTPGETSADVLTDGDAEPEAEPAELFAEAADEDAASETEEALPAETDNGEEEPAADEAPDGDTAEEQPLPALSPLTEAAPRGEPEWDCSVDGHNYQNGICTYCGWECKHPEFRDNVCTECGTAWDCGRWDHIWTDSGNRLVCEVCAAAHDCSVHGHEYTKGQNGQAVCADCGISLCEVIGHVWVPGEGTVGVCSRTGCTATRDCDTEGHLFKNSEYCSICGAECTHPIFDNGECFYCRYQWDCSVKGHLYRCLTQCVVCGAECSCGTDGHNWCNDSGRNYCVECGVEHDCEVHGHLWNYVSGSRQMYCMHCSKLYCSVNGHSWTQSEGGGYECWYCAIPRDCGVFGHSWSSNRVCTWCGLEGVQNTICESCGHTVVPESQVNGTPKYYETGDPEKHGVKTERTLIWLCPDCGNTIPTYEILEPEYDTDVHHFTAQNGTGVCEDCGYTHDCAVKGHLWYTDPASADNQPYDRLCRACKTTCSHQTMWISDKVEDLVKYDYKRVNDLEHSYLETGTEYIRCSECGKVQTKAWSGMGGEKHQYDQNGKCSLCESVCGHSSLDSNGKCSGCGWQCPHQNTYSYYILTEDSVYRYRPLDKRTCMEYVEPCIVAVACMDCGAFLFTVDGDDTFDIQAVNHSFHDGMCMLCGYECPHDPRGDAAAWYADGTYVVWTTENEKQCRWTTYDMIYQAPCYNCSSSVVIDPHYSLTGLSNHSYDSTGKCTNCGYQCKHLNMKAEDPSYATTEGTTSRYEFESNGSCAYYQDHMDLKLYCPDCFNWIAVESDVSWRRWADEHEWDENGVCENCGGKNTCPHRRVWESGEFGPTDDTEVTFTPLTPYTCKGTATNVLVEMVCEECGMCFPEFRAEYSATFDHRWGKDGVCECCGYSGTCEHNDIRTEYEWEWDSCSEYVPVDDCCHRRVIHHATVYRTCRVCGMKLETLQDADYVSSYTDAHLPNDDGVCEICGWENCRRNKCDHRNAVDVGYSYGDDTWSEYVFENTYTCTLMVYDVYQLMECPDCGEYFQSDKLMDRYADVEGHEWDKNGVCKKCGGKNTCTHPVVSLDKKNAVYQDVIYTYKNPTLCHASVKGIRGFTVCDLCHMRIEYSGEDAEFDVAHFWAEDGSVCRQCGGTNTCPHKRVETVDADYHEAVYTDTGDPLRHQAVYKDADVYVCCLDCYMRWYALRHADVTVSELHQWSEGQCEYCGHRKKTGCRHKDLIRINIVTPTYTQIDENTHRVWGTEAYRLICGACGEYFLPGEPEYYVKEVDYTEKHTVVNGECIYCGAAALEKAREEAAKNPTFALLVEEEIRLTDEEPVLLGTVLTNNRDYASMLISGAEWLIGDTEEAVDSELITLKYRGSELQLEAGEELIRLLESTGSEYTLRFRNGYTARLELMY